MDFHIKIHFSIFTCVYLTALFPTYETAFNNILTIKLPLAVPTNGIDIPSPDKAQAHPRDRWSPKAIHLVSWNWPLPIYVEDG